MMEVRDKNRKWGENWRVKVMGLGLVVGVWVERAKNTASIKPTEKRTSHCLHANPQTAAQREWEDQALNCFKLNSLTKYFSDELLSLCCSLQLSHPFLCSGRATLQLWQVGWPEGRKNWLGYFKVMLSCWDAVCLFPYKIGMTWCNMAWCDTTYYLI